MESSTTQAAKRSTYAAKRYEGPPPSPVRPWPLAGVLLGTAAFAAGMVCLFIVMREVAADNGGSCASGGPYVIRDGQECGDGVFALAYGGIGVAVAGFLLVLWCSWKYGRSLVVTAASGVGWGGFMGGLGALRSGWWP